MADVLDEEKASYTVFDTVYRTMVQKYPRLVIPLINELFGTSYDVDIESQQLRNEQLNMGKKLITDSIFRIQDMLYHLECQSTVDGTMAIRMFEYDAMIALEDARNNHPSRIRFPYAGVLYLRHTANTPDVLETEVIFPDNQTITYSIPVVKAKQYTIDDLFNKGLLLLLPFYIMRYENILQSLETNPQQAAVLLQDLHRITDKLETALADDEHVAIFIDLMAWIETVSSYILKEQPVVRKEVQDIMGGKILETRSERIFKAGQQERVIQFTKNLLMLHQPYDVIAKVVETSVEEVKRIAEKEGLAY